jgi:hypothetical protein
MRLSQHHFLAPALSVCVRLFICSIRISIVGASLSGCSRFRARAARFKALTILEIRIERIERMRKRIDSVRGGRSLRVESRSSLVGN